LDLWIWEVLRGIRLNLWTFVVARVGGVPIKERLWDAWNGIEIGMS